MTTVLAWPHPSDPLPPDDVCRGCDCERCECVVAAQRRPVPARLIGAGPSPSGLDPTFLADAPDVAKEGQVIAACGVPFLVEGIVVALGMLGMNVAFSKVGKTTFMQCLAAAVASGQPFLGRATRQTHVLIVAAEDPPEYTAWLARQHGDVPPGWLTFYRQPIQLDAVGLAQIVETVRAKPYGLVLISSWQAVVSSLVRDENDNAGSVRVVESVKAMARLTGVPWLIDAHAGKGEDQADDADPSRAMRGASAAAGAADYTLSLRYANGPFGSRRRLSGKGRFVNFAPLVLDYEEERGTYTVIGSAKDAMVETTWRLICETGALTTAWRSTDVIARTAGLFSSKTGKVTTTGRRQIAAALFKRDGVRVTNETRRGQQTSVYALMEAE